MKKLYNFIHIFVRAVLEAVLFIFGVFDIRPILSKNHKIKRVAFQAYSVHLAQHFESVITELNQNPEQFELHIIILQHPHFSLKMTKNLRTYFCEAMSIPGERIKYYFQSIWEKYDLILYSDVYAKFPIRKSCHYLLTHGPGLTNRFISKSIFRKTVFDFNKVLLSGEYDRQILEQCASQSEPLPEMITVGMPYLDRLKTRAYPIAEYVERLSLDPDKKTVLIAPSWRGLKLMHKQRIDYFRDVVNALENFDVNIIIKLHTCAYNTAMADGYNWHHGLHPFMSHPKVRIDEHIDDVPSMALSSVLVTGISSRAFNFMLLKKPVIMFFPIDLNSDPMEKSRMDLLRSGTIFAKSAEEIALLTGQLLEESTVSNASRAVASRCFSRFGNSTALVVNIIKQELNG